MVKWSVLEKEKLWIDLVGPYELHDFFLYQILRYGYRPAKVYRLAKAAFGGEYDGETIDLRHLATCLCRLLNRRLIPDIGSLCDNRNRSAHRLIPGCGPGIHVCRHIILI